MHLVLFFLNCLVGMKASEPGDMFIRRLLSTNLISLIDLLLFMLFLFEGALIVMSFKKFVHFLYIFKFIVTKLFIIFSYYPLPI